MASTIEEFKRLQPSEYFRLHLQQVGTISSAEGSAIVKQGETTVACGITAELAPPKEDAPDKGFVIPNVELPPIAHGSFKSGPPSEQAQEYATFIRDFLDNSEFVDIHKLCIKAGRLAWVLYVDLTCLNYDGNFLDCATKALVAALKNVTLPEVTLLEDNIIVDEGEEESEGQFKPLSESSISVDDQKRVQLELGSFPVSCTIAVFNDKLCLDPTDEEESLASATITIVLDSTTGELSHMKKCGGQPLSQKQIQLCIDMAKGVIDVPHIPRAT